MNERLHRYLNQHLAGSRGALLLIRHLSACIEDADAREFFLNLETRVRKDRAILLGLMASTRLDPSTPIRMAGEITARVGFLKLSWDGFRPGGLGLFEGLEMLALGIQGKRLLWLTLNEVSSSHPEWSGVDFTRLEMDAADQRDGVERWRIRATCETFPGTGPDLPAQTSHVSNPN
jgi:hypothetical protein